MIVFWLIALAMALAAVAALVLPLLRRRRGVRIGDDEALLSAYRERDAELVREHERGNIDDADLAEAREELERELLQAADGAGPATAARGVPGRPVATLASIAILVPLTAALVYVATGRPGLISTGGSSGLSPAQIERFRQMAPDQRIRALEPVVADNPGATRALVLLAQAYRANGRYGDAVDAYARVRATADEEDPWLLARQSEALLLANGRNFTTSVERLLERALELDGDNPLALLMSGHAAMARGDNARAIEYWQRMAEGMPEGSDNRAMLDRLIARARDGGGAPEQQSAANGATPDASGSTAGDGAPRVSVRVRLADHLAEATPADTPVFVFARGVGANGGGPPLAVARTTVGALPANIRLTDDNAMTSSARLSQAERVRVTARASLSGGVTPQDGDLQGLSGPITVGPTASAEIVIDSRVGADVGAAGKDGNAGTGGSDGKPQVAVSVRLAASLADAAPADTPVFVFARPVGADRGGPPLAVGRTTIDALPARIRLTDGDAMTSSRRLSQAERVRVTARAALSGGVVPQSGDLEGSSDPVTVGPAAGAEITIDRRIP